MVNFAYIFALLFLCAVYAVTVYLMKYMRKTWLFNCVFMSFVFIPYILISIIVYRDVGFYDWNFQNLLPCANVSPFMFFITPFLLVLPKFIKRHLHLLISLLSVGMFLSSVVGCFYNFSINYKFHHHFLLDYVSHFSLSLFGIYLIRTRQVELTLKNSALSASVIYGVAMVMMILNVIFDKSFFGLSLNGKHNIYNNILTDNSYLSALLYFVGLGAVLCLGFLLCRIFKRDGFYIEKE